MNKAILFLIIVVMLASIASAVPEVNNISLYNISGNTWNVTANVTDDTGVSTVIAQITQPTLGNVNYTMGLLTGNIYNFTFYATEDGQHNITIYANDTLGNNNNGTTFSPVWYTPKHYYELESSGLDTGSTSTSTTGTVNGFVAGVVNNSVDVSGAQRLTNTSFTTASTIRTVDIWVNTDVTDNVYRDAAGISDGTTDNMLQIAEKYGDGTNRLYFRLRTGASTNWELFGPTIGSSVWNHAVLTMGTGGAKLYINGTLVDSDPSTVVMGASHSQIAIADRGDASSYWDGKIDNLAFFTEQYTAAEANQSYNQGSGKYFLETELTSTSSFVVTDTYTPVNVTISQYNMTSNGGCTVWNTDKQTACNTTDTTPTVKFITDVDATCAFGLNDLNISRMVDYNWTNNGNVNTSATGIVGSAASFDGTSPYEYLNTGNQINLNDQSFTISLWAYIAGTGERGDEQHIWGYYPGSAPMLAIQYDYSEESFEFTTRNATTGPTRDTFGAATGAWHHVVAWYNATGDLSAIYLNGTRKQIGVAASGDMGGDEEMWIGKAQNTGATTERNLNGSVDEIILYDRIISDEEIQELYDAGTANTRINTTGLIRYINFDNRTCSTTGSTSHTCTLIAADELAYNQSNTYLGCEDVMGMQNSTSSSGALLVDVYSVPSITNLSSPANNTNSTFNYPDLWTFLNWTRASNEDGKPITYTLYINETLNASTTNLYENLSIAINQSYAWKVETTNGPYTGGNSTTFTFHYTVVPFAITWQYCGNVSPDIEPNITYYNVTTRTITQLGALPVNMTGNECYINITNSGNIPGSVNASLNATPTRHSINCANIQNLTTIPQNLTSLGPQSDRLINCTADYLNATSVFDFNLTLEGYE